MKNKKIFFKIMAKNEPDWIHVLAVSNRWVDDKWRLSSLRYHNKPDFTHNTQSSLLRGTLHLRLLTVTVTAP